MSVDLFGEAPPLPTSPPRRRETEEPRSRTVGAEPSYRFEPPAGIVWDESMKPNPGYCPEEARGKRIKVQLANGTFPLYAADLDPMAPPGWPADRAACNAPTSGGSGPAIWKRRGLPFDIARYKVIA